MKNHLNFIQTSTLCFLVLCFLSLLSCEPRHFVKQEAIFLTLEKIKAARDSNDLSISTLREDEENTWFVVHNKIMTTPSLYLFHIENHEEPPHEILLKSRQKAIVERVFFEDVTHDEKFELILDLYYDYSLNFQGREIVVLQHPFDTLRSKEIFQFFYEQSSSHIDSFNANYGNPIISKNVIDHASFEFFKGLILIKGTLNGRKNHLVEYQWVEQTKSFKLIIDEDLHEVEDEEGSHELVHKVKGSKVLIPMTAHEEGCLSYLLEDEQGHIIEVSKHIHDALLCSPYTSLCKDGAYLVYTDKQRNALCLYHFDGEEDEILLPNLQSYEGISEIIWAPGKKKRFALIAVNPEELLYNSILNVYTINEKNNSYSLQSIDINFPFQCDQVFCLPVKDYDMRFRDYTNFEYRSSRKDNTFTKIQLQ